MSAAKRGATAAAAPNPLRPETWPVVWRVVIPGAGSYDHDWVMVETEDEAEARGDYRARRSGGWPVRLEKVQCGPLPKDHKAAIAETRAASPQNPGSKARPILGAWTKPERRRS
jgi:hypothetical protein